MLDKKTRKPAMRVACKCITGTRCCETLAKASPKFEDPKFHFLQLKRNFSSNPRSPSSAPLINLLLRSSSSLTLNRLSYSLFCLKLYSSGNSTVDDFEISYRSGIKNEQRGSRLRARKCIRRPGGEARKWKYLAYSS